MCERSRLRASVELVVGSDHGVPVCCSSVQGHQCGVMFACGLGDDVLQPLALLCVVTARTMMLVSTTCTDSLFGSIASHVVDDVANLLNALLRGIAGGQGEADVVAGLPIDVPIGRCDFDRSLMESEVHTGSRLQAGSLSKGLVTCR